MFQSIPSTFLNQLRNGDKVGDPPTLLGHIPKFDRFLLKASLSENQRRHRDFKHNLFFPIVPYWEQCPNFTGFFFEGFPYYFKCRCILRKKERRVIDSLVKLQLVGSQELMKLIGQTWTFKFNLCFYHVLLLLLLLHLLLVLRFLVP